MDFWHLIGRGVDKRDIFMDEYNLSRFILSVKEFNTIKPTGGIKELSFRRPTSDSDVSDVQRLTEEKPLVSIVCYCFNPNHSLACE